MIDSGICDDGSPFIAFELLEGQSLDTVLNKGPLAPSEVVRIGLAACAGLSAAHAVGVVHRDLKPSNIFLCQDGAVKVLDFGIARLHLDNDLTATGDVIGTPSYISPEQARGRTDVDVRSDVWGLGALLYHAAAGRPPHKAHTVLATLVQVVMDDVAPLAQVMPGTPPQLADAIDKALKRDPDERWKDIDELADALDSAELHSSGLRIPLAHSGLIASGERRVVAILLAEAVTDLGALTRAVSSRGGVVIPLLGGTRDRPVRRAHLGGRRAGARDGSRARVPRLGRANGGGVGARQTIGLQHLRRRARTGGGGARCEPQGSRGRSGDRQELVVDLRADAARAGRPRGLPRADARLELGRAGDAAGRARGGARAHRARAIRVAFGEGRSFALLVHGPPGIGKSRLRQETVRGLRRFRVLDSDGADPNPERTRATERSAHRARPGKERDRRSRAAFQREEPRFAGIDRRAARGHRRAG